MVFLPFKDIFRHKRMKAFGGSRGSAMAMPEKNIGLLCSRDGRQLWEFARLQLCIAGKIPRVKDVDASTSREKMLNYSTLTIFSTNKSLILMINLLKTGHRVGIKAAINN